jgi:hypothetical protein
MPTALTGRATRAHHRARLAPCRGQDAVRWDEKMSKEELIQFEGLVIKILPDARYRVHLDAGYEVVAYTAVSEHCRTLHPGAIPGNLV